VTLFACTATTAIPVTVQSKHILELTHNYEIETNPKKDVLGLHRDLIAHKIGNRSGELIVGRSERAESYELDD
jgi:hypothetical protein